MKYQAKSYVEQQQGSFEIGSCSGGPHEDVDD